MKKKKSSFTLGRDSKVSVTSSDTGTECTGYSPLIADALFPLYNALNHGSCLQHCMPSLQDVVHVMHSTTIIFCTQFS